MNGIDKLKKAACDERLFYRIKMICKNSTHYYLSKEVAEYFGTEQRVLHEEVGLSEFGKKIIFLTGPNDELVTLPHMMK